MQALMPTLAIAGSGKWLAALSLIALVIFVAIQLWLVFTTVATLRTSQAKESGSPFRLRLGAELFWTALPIVMTIALAWASFALWLNRSRP
jgi:heme/copper-type cytochrome/quinol oxidase subunit 2